MLLQSLLTWNSGKAWSSESSNLSRDRWGCSADAISSRWAHLKPLLALHMSGTFQGMPGRQNKQGLFLHTSSAPWWPWDTSTLLHRALEDLIGCVFSYNSTSKVPNVTSAIVYLPSDKF